MDRLDYFNQLNNASNLLFWACNAEGRVTFLSERWNVPIKDQDFLEVLGRWICDYELGNTEWQYLDAFHKKTAMHIEFKHTSGTLDENYKLLAYPLVENGQFLGYSGLCMPITSLGSPTESEPVTYGDTQLFNQAYLERVVKALLKKKEQEDYPFSLIGLQFKSKVPGQYFLLSDAEIAEFAEIYKRTLRKRDLACYFGDNRFVLLVQTGPKEVSGIVHRLCGLLHCEFNDIPTGQRYLVNMVSVHADEAGTMAQMMHLLEKRINLKD